MTAQTAERPTITVGGRTFHQPFGMEGRINWMLLGLFVMLLLYWFFVASLERVDGAIVMARLFYRDVPLSEAASLPIPGIVTALVEYIHPRVLRHFIPVIVGWWLATEAAISFIQVFYDCPDRKTARGFLKRHRRRSPGAGGDAYSVSPQTLGELKDESIMLRVGGPVNVAVQRGDALVTELNARYDRVLGSGVHLLNHFEYVQAVVALQRQERAARDVALVTREGIPVTADVQIVFQVDPGDQPPTEARPTPYNRQAVHDVAYAHSVLPNGSVSSWDQIPLSKVKRSLAQVVAQYGLDDLLAPGSSARDMHRAIRDQVEREISADLEDEGIRLVQLNIGRITPPDEVSEQYTEYWLAGAQKQDQIARANGAARAMQQVEIVEVEAEIAMLQALVESVRRVQAESGGSPDGYVLALRLVETLEKVVQQSQLRLQGGDESAIELMPRLDSLAEQLSRLEEVSQTGMVVEQADSVEEAREANNVGQIDDEPADLVVPEDNDAYLEASKSLPGDSAPQPPISNLP